MSKRTMYSHEIKMVKKILNPHIKKLDIIDKMNWLGLNENLVNSVGHISYAAVEIAVTDMIVSYEKVLEKRISI